MKIPEELNDRYLASIILFEETETEQLKQEAVITRKHTESMVRLIPYLYHRYLIYVVTRIRAEEKPYK